jgi:hypothetical protein
VEIVGQGLAMIKDNYGNALGQLIFVFASEAECLIQLPYASSQCIAVMFSNKWHNSCLVVISQTGR